MSFSNHLEYYNNQATTNISILFCYVYYIEPLYFQEP
jgi:hypothetical protein